MSRFIFLSVALCMVLAGVLVAPARAAFSTITLVGQSDPDTHKGYFLNLENNRDGDDLLTLHTLTLTLAVGDGAQWTYLHATPTWITGHTYTVQAVLSPTSSQLLLDGQTVATSPTRFVPADKELIANYADDWANPTTAYWAVENSLAVQGRSRLTQQFTLAPSDLPALFFSARQPLRHLPVGATFVPSERLRPVGGNAEAAEGNMSSRRAAALAVKRNAWALTFRVTFTLVARPADPSAFAPLIDKYGQVTHGTWPGKIVSDTQLVASADDEQKRLQSMPGLPGIDAYGGMMGAGWRETPTGFYRVTTRSGTDWLVTPTGFPCFYTSVCTAPLLYGNGTPVSGREGQFAALPPRTPPYDSVYHTDIFGDHDGTQYVSFDTANMITKYGSGWPAVSEPLTKQRLRSWGFAGFGKWSDPIPGVPYLSVLNRSDVPTLHGKPDPFDPAVRAKITASLEAQIRVHRDDPFLVGWSLGNEHDEIVEHDTITGILADTTATPAKKALLDDAVKALYHGSLAALVSAWNVSATSAASVDALGTQPLVAPAADGETLRRFFADRYYACLYDTVKALDPHHLYMGFWIVPTWWENESDWTLIARHCDVLGYDYYGDRFADPYVQSLIRQAGKPVFCGEFGYPPTYDARRGYGLFRSWTADDADAGRHYGRWMQDASLNPHCIGGSWFEYRDEPVTGRGPGRGPQAIYGENYAFGLVDVADRPKWDLISGVRAANRAAGNLRLHR